MLNALLTQLLLSDRLIIESLTKSTGVKKILETLFLELLTQYFPHESKKYGEKERQHVLLIQKKLEHGIRT